MPFFAHTLPNDPDPEHWELLAQHEERVAERCRELAERLDVDLAAWGDLLGRWHDIGKYSEPFQAYLQKGSSDTTQRKRRELGTLSSLFVAIQSETGFANIGPNVSTRFATLDLVRRKRRSLGVSCQQFEVRENANR